MFLFIMAGVLCLPLVANNSSQGSNELVWCGIDYTLVKFIGSADQFNDLPKIQSYYFRAWNEIVQAESGKYDLNKAFSVATVHYNMEKTILRSQERDMNGILQFGPYSIDEEQVKSVVMLNTDPSTDKLGAMFVMETLNKTEAISTMWLAVFNLASGEILYLKRYIGAVGGFGFRNYYARSLYNVIKNLKMTPRNL